MEPVDNPQTLRPDSGRTGFWERFSTLEGGAAYFWMLIVLLFLFCVLDQSNYERNQMLGQFFGGTTLALCAGAGVVLHLNGKLGARNAIILLIIGGFGLKLSFALTNGWYAYQHDVESLKTSGHLSYIYGLAGGKGLPATNDWQFNHPPLHHLIAAGSLKLSRLLGFSDDRAFENIQLLSVFYSSACMVVAYKILREIRIRGKVLVLCMLLFCFHPTFTILAGSINNDVLTLLLSMAALLYLLRWYQKPCLKYAAALGIFTGLAVMTKFSAALLVAVIAVVVLQRFVSGLNTRASGFTFGALAGQTGMFALFAAPLGLWYQIRNMILFSQPLGYVVGLSPTSHLYCGDVSVWKRLFTIPLTEFSSKLYASPDNDYSLPGYTLKCSLFGEYQWPGREGFGWVLFWLNLALVLLTLAALIYVLRRGWDQFAPGALLIFGFAWALQLISFVVFNLRFPFGCTMDFRYIAITLISAVVFLGMAGTLLERSRSRIARILLGGGGCAAAAFAVCSVLFYL